MSDPNEIDGEHVAFKIKRIKDELGPGMQLPVHCDFCYEVAPKHSPTCMAPKKSRSARPD